MKIRLKSFFHFDVAQAFGSDRLELPGDQITLRKVLEEIVRRTGGRVDIIDTDGQGIGADYFVLVNGVEVQPATDNLDKELREGDEVGVGMMHFWGGG